MIQPRGLSLERDDPNDTAEGCRVVFGRPGICERPPYPPHRLEGKVPDVGIQGAPFWTLEELFGVTKARPEAVVAAAAILVHLRPSLASLGPSWAVGHLEPS